MTDRKPRDDKGHFVPLECPNPACGSRPREKLLRREDLENR
jgi:hypothetical protein